MMDQSYREFFVLITRPFVEEMPPGWRMIRYFCLGFGFTAVCLWAGTWLLPSPRFDRATGIFVATSRYAFIFFLITYLSCCIEAYLVHRARERERIKSLKAFD